MPVSRAGNFGLADLDVGILLVEQPVGVVEADLPLVVPASMAERLVSDPVAWFTSERLNLLDAAKRAGVNGWHDLAIQLASRQGGFQHLQNRNDDTTELWYEIVLITERSSDSTALANARLRAAAALIERGQPSDAKELLDNCIEEFERTADEAALSYAMYWRASSESHLGFMDAAIGDAAQGVAFARKTENRHAEFMNLRAFGWACVCGGYHEKGLAACELAMSIAGELGEQSYELVALGNLASSCALAGQHDRALALTQKLLAASRQLGDVRDEGVALGILGDAYRGLGRYREAMRALNEALPIFRSNAHRRNHALCLLKLGYTCQGMGNHTQAIEYLKACQPMFRELSLGHYEDRAREAMAHSLAATSVALAK